MTKVEEVARAIYESRNGAGCRPWSIQPKAHKEPYMADARAAIGIASGADMIDAALKEDEK